MSAAPASGSPPGFWDRTKNFVSSLDAPAIIAGIGASIVVFVGATLAVRRIFQSETPQPSQDVENRSASPVGAATSPTKPPAQIHVSQASRTAATTDEQHRRGKLEELFNRIRSSQSHPLSAGYLMKLTSRFEPFEERDKKLQYLKWRCWMFEQHADEHQLLTNQQFIDLLTELLVEEPLSIFDRFVKLLTDASLPPTQRDTAQRSLPPTPPPRGAQPLQPSPRDARPRQPSPRPGASPSAGRSVYNRERKTSPPTASRYSPSASSNSQMSTNTPQASVSHTGRTPSSTSKPGLVRSYLLANTESTQGAKGDRPIHHRTPPPTPPLTPPRTPPRRRSPNPSPSLMSQNASAAASSSKVNRTPSPSLMMSQNGSAAASSSIAAHYTSFRSPNRGKRSPYRSPTGSSSNKQQPVQCHQFELPRGDVNPLVGKSSFELTMTSVAMVGSPLRIYAGTSQGEVVEFSLDSAEAVNCYSSPGLTRVDSIVASEDCSTLFAIGNPNGSVVHWGADTEMSDGQVLPKPCWDATENRFVEGSEAVGSVKLTTIWLTPGGDVLIAGCSSGLVAGWSLHDNRWVRKWGEQQNWPVNRVCTSGDDLFVATRRHHPTQWHYHTGELIKEFGGEVKEVLVLAVANGNLFSAGRDHQVSMYDIESGDLCRTFPGEIGFVDCLAVRGEMLFFGGWDSTVKMCHTTENTAAVPILFEGQQSAIRCVALVDEEEPPMFDASRRSAIELYTAANCRHAAEMFCVQKYRVKVVQPDVMAPLEL